MKKWKILFLVKAVDISIRELVIMLNELRSLFLGTEIEMYFCITLKDHLIEHVKSGNTSLPRLNRFDRNATVFLKLVADEHTATFPFRFDDIREPSTSFDISKAEDVQLFFTLANGLCPSKRNMVVTWDHGRGFGINPKLIIRRKSLLPRDEEITGDVNDSLLTVEELALALKNTFQKKQVDVILMMNCSMHVIDAGYALRNSVDYLVGSQPIMNFFGYNYPYIFQTLIGNPNISSRDLAKISVSSFPAKIYPLTTSADLKASSAFFATDLKQYDFVVEQISQLSRHLSLRMSTLKADILSARAKCYINEASNMIDFYSFLFELYKSNKFEDASHVISLLLSTKNLVVIESYVGESFKPTIPPSNILPTGFSIYFPAALPTQAGDFMKTDFFRFTQWKLLLNAISND